MEIFSVFTLFAGLHIVNYQRKALERCPEKHGRNDMYEGVLCRRNSDRIHQLIICGIFASTLGGFMAWQLYGIASAIDIISQLAIYVALACATTSLIHSYQIYHHRRAKVAYMRP